MFHIIKSNRMENLMQGLLSLLAEAPLDPLKPEWIVIQSRGMKQWITLETARAFGISAHTHFLFPRRMVDEILGRFKPLRSPDRDFSDGMDEDFFFWSAMGLVRNRAFQDETGFVRNYLSDDKSGKKQFQLCTKIARVFDDYQVYRPDLILKWLESVSPDCIRDPGEKWQARLRQMMAAGFPGSHPAADAQVFLNTFAADRFDWDGLPPRICFFGLSSLPPLFLKIFDTLSRTMDLYFFLLTPTNRFFLDLRPEKEIQAMVLKNETDLDALYYDTGHPLLSSLGVSGRQFHACLESLDYHEPLGDLFADPLEDAETVLTVLQSDILNLVNRKPGGDAPAKEVDPGDTSLRIHACHSPMRETQVVKDLLLNEFEQDPDLLPHEVIVMTPDIETYAPFVESVFALDPPLPFGVSDRRKRSESEHLEAFLAILALRETRLEKTRILDLLVLEPIAGKFGIRPEDLSLVEQMVDAAGILWGKDETHRSSLGFPDFGEHTWRFGLDRLFMGVAMPEGHDELVRGVLPLETVEGSELEVLGRLGAFCRNLFSGLDQLQDPRPMTDWRRILRHLAGTLIAWDGRAGEDRAFLMDVLDRMAAGSVRAGFDEPLPFEGVFGLLEKKLDANLSHGRFMSGALTICNLTPMRSIPFKIVVLMGMDETSFPRRTVEPGFSLMKKNPRPGDKNDRNDDRYLFLETLLSARKKLIITYTGMSIRDNSPIPCAGVVSELQETLDQGFVFPEGAAYRVVHPLHPFHRSYFESAGPLFSYSAHYGRMAEALALDKVRPRPFVRPGEDYPSAEAFEEVSIEDLIRFFKNPIQSFLRDGLNLSFVPLEEAFEDRESFFIPPLDQYRLGGLLLEKHPDESRIQDLYPFFKAMGGLPPGLSGRLAYDRVAALATPLISEVRRLTDGPGLPPLSETLSVNGVRVSGFLTRLRPDGAWSVDFGKLTAARVLSAWIRHLFLTGVGPAGYPRRTLIVGRDPEKRKPFIRYEFRDPGAEGLRYFADLVEIYQKGIQAPFWFFCETGFQFVRTLRDPRKSAAKLDLLSEAVNQARKVWHDAFRDTGEKLNRYVSLCVADQDLFDHPDILTASGFADNAMRVYEPLLDHLEESE